MRTDLGDQIHELMERGLRPVSMADIENRSPARVTAVRSAVARLGLGRGRLILAGAVGIAACVALAVTALLPGSGSRSHTSQARVHLDRTAASVLHRAALAALRLPARAPQPDQFVYVEWANGVRTRQLYQAWLSVDGTRNGLIRSGGRSSVDPGCHDGHQADQHGYSCVPAPAFLPGMPATPRGVLRYLEKTYGLRLGTGKKSLDRLGTTVDGLLSFTYLLPRQRAALYELLAQTPGFTVVPHAADVIGRQGIGVSWALPRGGDIVIIFDRRTYAELGLIAKGSGKDRNYEFGRALLKIAIVSKTGQLP
jgi:hypothetical protein